MKTAVAIMKRSLNMRVKSAIVIAMALAAPACKKEDDTVHAPAETVESSGTVASIPAAPADVAAPPADADKNESGIASKVIVAGTGSSHPILNDSVKVSFTGWTTDGMPFTHGNSFSFHVARAIPGWTEALSEMVVGETRRIWIPPTMTYVQPSNAPSGMLVFDLALLEITPGPAAPADIASAPESELTTKTLTAGTGSVHPAINDLVKVTFASWTSDGNAFYRGDEVPIVLARAIPAWTQTLQQMVVGETRRLWVPPALGYGEQPGAPTGMLVFDLRLDDIAVGPKPPVDVSAAPADSKKGRRGFASRVMIAGSGRAHPRLGDSVRVRYSSWRRDGMLVDSSGNNPVVRPVQGAFEGWTEALRQMVVGQTQTFWIPSNLGPKVKGAVTPDLTLVVELLEILTPPKAPPDLRAPSRGAIVERDGLASKILTKGTGTVHPTKSSTVTVDYAGWTSDGKLMSSSYTRGGPAMVTVGSDLPGFTEALQLMVEGEKRRVWIPRRLAYQSKSDAPQGMLVFDIQLQKIHPGAPL